jgi:phage recombination protein Bet
MSTELATVKPSAIRLMAERCFVEPDKLHATLKNTVFKGATDDEMLALIVTANVYELNPLLKELYAFPKKGGGITPMVGVDGWLKIANRQANYDGMNVEVYGSDKNPTHATCEIFLKDRSHSVKITEYFEECRRNTDPWNQMPRRMLRNKVMIQAIRVAFGIGGIQDEDEAQDIGDNAFRQATGHVVETSALTRVITGESTPASSASVAAPAKATKAAPAPAKEKPAPAPSSPTRPDMVDGIRKAFKAAGHKLPAAEEIARTFGILGEGVGLSSLTDEEMGVVFARRFELYPPPEESQANEEASTEGGTEA